MPSFLFIGALLFTSITGFVFAWRGLHWARAWLLASLFVPVSLLVNQIVAPTPWFGVALVFGSLTGIFLGGAAVLAAHLAAKVLAGSRADKAQQTVKSGD